MSNWELHQTFIGKDGKRYAVYRGNVVVSHCQLDTLEPPRETPRQCLAQLDKKALLDELEKAAKSDPVAQLALRDVLTIIKRERGNVVA